MRNFVFLSLLATTPLFVSSDARAEAFDEASASEADHLIETVASGQDDYEDPRHPSGFVSRLATGSLFARGQTLGQALSTIPGLYVLEQSSYGQSAFVSLRGGNPRQLVVLFDGIRINVPAGLGFDVGQLSTVGLSSVDVYRGSAGSVFGAGALTGALSLNPAAPSDPGWSYSATTLAGSFGTAGASAMVGRSNERAGLRLSAGYRQSKGDFFFVDEQGTDHGRVNNDHRRISLVGAGRIAQGDHELRASVLFEDGEAGSPGPSEFQEALSLARTDDHRLVASTHWATTDALTPSWGAIDTEVGLGYQQRRFLYHNPQGFMTRTAFENEATHQAVIVKGQGAAFMTAGNITRLATEARREWYETSSISLERRAFSITRQTFSGALSNELFLAEDALSLFAALRAEAVTDEHFGATPILPALGAIWRIHRGVSFKANAARTFRTPDFDELYLDTEAVRGNPNLAPEQAWTFDAGILLSDLRPGHDAWRLGLVAFDNHVTDMILFLPASAYTFEAMNLPETRNRGVELTTALAPLNRLRLHGSYTFTRAYLKSDRDARHQLPHQPLHRGRLRLETDLSDLGPSSHVHHLSLYTSAHYRSRIHLDHFQNLHNPAAFFLDAGLTLSPTARLGLDLSARNLLDHRRAEDTLQRPLPGRAFYLGLTLRSP